MLNRMRAWFSRRSSSSLSLPSSSESEDHNTLDIQGTQFTLLNFGVFALFCLALYSLIGASKVGSSDSLVITKYFGLLGMLSLVGFASFAGGGLLGFLFGIPKSNTEKEVADNHSVLPEEERRAYLNNTNLEEMSDWLTKIIIGAGLVGLKDLVAYFRSAMGSLATKLEGAPFASLVLSADFIGFGILGFFTIYLLTRLFWRGLSPGRRPSSVGRGDLQRGQRTLTWPTCRPRKENGLRRSLTQQNWEALWRFLLALSGNHLTTMHFDHCGGD